MKKIQARKIGLFLYLVSSLFSASMTYACQIELSYYWYEEKNGRLFYIGNKWDYSDSRAHEIINEEGDRNGSRFSGEAGKGDFDLKNFRRVIPVVQGQYKWFDNAVWSREDRNYFTDNKTVVFGMMPIESPSDAPVVDIATFKQPFEGISFAVDKDSVYYQGKRTDSNSGDRKVDLETLEKMKNGMLRDKNSLFYRGHYLGTSENFEIIESRPRGNFMCLGGEEYISRNKKTVFIDGEPISEADPATFEINRWSASTVLEYKDKNGIHYYIQNKKIFRQSEIEEYLSDPRAAKEPSIYY